MGQFRWCYVVGKRWSIQAKQWHAIGLVPEGLADIEDVCDSPESRREQDQPILDLKIVHGRLIESIDRAEWEVERHLLPWTEVWAERLSEASG